MDPVLITVSAFAALFTLLFLGIPVAFGMAAVGLVGFTILVNEGPALSMLGQAAFDSVIVYEFSVLPLFLLMGNFVAQSGLSRDLYDASNAFLGHRRGGLAMATIVACGGFSAVTGSSLATAATMSKIAIPSMRRYGYSDSLAAGSIAAGGTLGILIPPSIILVIYGIIVEQDISRLFIAGIVPGLVGIVLYLVAVDVITRLKPEDGPKGERTAWPERWRTLKYVWGVVLLFFIVIGGIYFGVFTPTEAAGVGAAGAFLFALLRRRVTFWSVVDVLVETGRNSAMIFILYIGAVIFANFLNVSGAPHLLSQWVGSLDVQPILVIVAMMVIYLILGCVLESLSMMLLTVPLFYPIAAALGFDLIWFGIIVVVVIEISLITPPIGLNVFMLNSVLPEVPVMKIFKGVGPFIVVDVIRLALFLAVPAVVLTLPRLMG